MKELNLNIGLGYRFTLHAWYDNVMPDEKQILIRNFYILLWYNLKEIVNEKVWMRNTVNSMHVFNLRKKIQIYKYTYLVPFKKRR